MNIELEARREMVETLRYLWDRGHANTTGVSISVRLSKGRILVDQSGTGFKKCHITSNDLLIIDEECELVEDAPNQSFRKAPVNVVIHTKYYKENPLAHACIHCHAPYTQVFACSGRDIPPYTLQALTMGDVPCIIIDDRALKAEMKLDSVQVLSVPSGLHDRPDVFYVMDKVGDEVVRRLKPRNDEMRTHGLAVTHYQHGIFVFGRSLGEAFDNLERAEANARIILLSKNLS